MIGAELLLLTLASLNFQAGDDDRPMTMQLFEFLREDAAADWRAVHDSVMGGRSTGRVVGSTGEVQLIGEVSLENNGGFASFRVEPLVSDLSEFHGLRLEVLGQGHNWKLSLRTGQGREDLNWQAPFWVEGGAWTTVEIPFSAFTPVYHGRFVADAPPLDASAIQSIGLLIGDKQAGPFDLRVRELEAWRVEPRAAEQGSVGAAIERTNALDELLELDVELSKLLATLRWKERLVVVSEPAAGGDLGARASIQMGRFLARPEALALRDIRLVHLVGASGGRIAGRTLSPDAVAQLRKVWELPPERWTVTLVRKDGDVVEHWSEPIEPETVFDLIDAMPMARGELGERR